MKRLYFALIAFLTISSINAATNEMTVLTSKKGAAVQSTMYGIFFEDINFAADGGLYAEMIMASS